jgi:hypothetical protein
MGERLGEAVPNDDRVAYRLGDVRQPREGYSAT